MYYAEELIAAVGSVDRFDVIVYQPHLDPDLTCVGLETPDGKTWDLDADDTTKLAALLLRAPMLKAAKEQLAEDDDEDE